MSITAKLSVTHLVAGSRKLPLPTLWSRNVCNAAALINGRSHVTPLQKRALSTFSPAATTTAATVSLRNSRFSGISATAMQQHQTFCSAANESEETSLYTERLLKTAFTTDLNVSDDTPIIPIYRIFSPEGQFLNNTPNPLSEQETIDAFKFITKLSIWDDILYNIQRQGRISFYIQNQGEEALQTAVGMALKMDDSLWCQYRELGTLMWRGFSIENVLDQCFGTADDPGKGRQMPISYTSKEINLPSISTPLTTQVPHASGAGYAMKLLGKDACAVAFFGEGAASEGDFHAAMNFAAVMKSQTIFVCRNNGYAISTPAKEQYAGDGIAIRGISYGMHSVRVDGNDLFASYLAMKKCREICVEQSVPVCIEFMTYRMGHHSTSDDSAQYRLEGEFDIWSKGYHPRSRLKSYLIRNGMWTEEEDKKLIAEAKSVFLKKVRHLENKKHAPIISGIFDDVYSHSTQNLEEQASQLKEFLSSPDNHNFNLEKFIDV